MRYALAPLDAAYAIRTLNVLPRRVQFKHLRIALSAAGGIIRTRAVMLARRQTGLLAKSIGVKVVIPDASYNSAHHGKPAYVIIGPKRRSGRMIHADTLKSCGLAQRALKKSRAGLKEEGSGRSVGLTRERTAVKLTLRKFAGALYRNPARYAHLVEKGTRRTRAYPFLDPAAQQSRPAAFSAFAEKIRIAVNGEAGTLAGSQK